MDHDELILYLNEVLTGSAGTFPVEQLSLSLAVNSAKEVQSETKRTRQDRVRELRAVFTAPVTTEDSDSDSDSDNSDDETDASGRGLRPSQLLSDNTYIRVLVSAGGGCGKTLLSTILMRLAAQACLADSGKPVPFLISLLEIARRRSLSIPDFIVSLYGDSPRAQLLMHLLQSGHLLLILDGYDALDTTNTAISVRGDFNEHIRSQLSHSTCRMVITSRPRRFPTQLFGSFLQLRILPLSRAQQLHWVKTRVPEDQSRGILLALQNPALVELASTPLLLTYLLSAARDITEVSTAVRMPWFSGCLQLLLREHDERKHNIVDSAFDAERRDDLSILRGPQVVTFLQKIAYLMHHRRLVYFEDADVKRLIAEDPSAHYGRCWVALSQSALLLCDDMNYRFVSHTLQQVLAAFEVVAVLNEKLIKHTGMTALFKSTSLYFNDEFSDRLYSFWSHETLAVTCHLLSDDAFLKFAEHLITSDDTVGTNQLLVLELAQEHTRAVYDFVRQRMSGLRRCQSMSVMLLHWSCEVRRLAVLEYLHIGMPNEELRDLIDVLIDAVRNMQSPRLTRLAALDSVKALALSQTAILGMLLERVRDRSEAEDVRCAAVQAIRSCGRGNDVCAIELIPLLDDESPVVKAQAREALVTEPFLGFLMSRRENLHIANALARLGVQDSAMCLHLMERLAAAAAPVPEMLFVMKILAEMRTVDAQVMHCLLTMTARENQQVARSAAEVLCKLCPPGTSNLAADLQQRLQESIHACEDPVIKTRLLYALADASANETTLPTFVSFLKDSSVAVRWVAVRGICASGVTNNESLLVILAQYLDDENIAVKIAHAVGRVSALSPLYRERVTNVLIRALQKHITWPSDPANEGVTVNITVEALQVLQSLGLKSPAISAAVLSCLFDNDDDVRLAAAQALQYHVDGDADQVAMALAFRTSDISPRVRVELARQLAVLASTHHGAAAGATEGLTMLMFDGLEAVRVEALDAARKLSFGKEQVIDALLKRLETGDDSTRSLAAWALGELGAALARVVRTLQQKCEDSALEVRMNSARALVKLQRNVKVAIPVLVNGLEMESGRTKASTVSALRQTNFMDARFISDLVVLAASSEAIVATEALKTLEGLNPTTDEEAISLVSLLTQSRCAVFVFKPLLAFFRKKHVDCPYWWITKGTVSALEQTIKKKIAGSLETALLLRELKLTGALPASDV
eukprot:TRINITY_DN699_c0_g1_i11.p1 TRINITY_DN699_c0_g1~~TRINITY_DN699_c0_g1_i11.p1  ORF type:complete len:1206 (+),score=283.01 TRINITY_DN699_c0_g1_i11:101-3718(+)